MSAIILAILGGAAYVMYHIVRAVFFGLGELGGAVIDSPATGKAFDTLWSWLSRKEALVLAVIPVLLSASLTALMVLLGLTSVTPLEGAYSLGLLTFLFTALPAIGFSILILLVILLLISVRKSREKAEREKREWEQRLKEAKSTYGAMLHYLLADPTNPVGWGERATTRLSKPKVYERSKLRFSPDWPYDEYPAGKQLYEWIDSDDAVSDKVTHAVEWSLTIKLPGYRFHHLKIWLLLNHDGTPASFVVAHSNDRSRLNEKFTIEACALTEVSLKETLTYRRLNGKGGA